MDLKKKGADTCDGEFAIHGPYAVFNFLAFYIWIDIQKEMLSVLWDYQRFTYVYSAPSRFACVWSMFVYIHQQAHRWAAAKAVSSEE